ncbi:ExbD/TolR family protein [Flavihumibacter profundi]|jgi:biopolymer transport protein ExbD|uniref:ExbD/TolR family protein n=1 Tax=Flavihumibacter profundi TaxID=2716883 RepID=UPI001CC781BA|nr:biopolymer transporter ExbD [Flavihumibacter profundi]MBZ5859457.1 biopolymer transporter ExbD [Flavihumibacter profundi]
MAELDTSGGGHKKGPGVKKGKKLSTRVDLTPMVDLGFLLITFFIFTTTMSQPTAMRLNLPKDTEEKDQNKVKASGALTLLLGKNDNIFYYEGELLPDASNFKTTGFKEIRDVILTKKKSTNAEDFVVVIKPNKESTYKNTVDILDEMTINGVKRYALVDISPVEDQLIAATQGATPQ